VTSYLTLPPGDVTAELEVKRSRFLAVVRRVADQAAAQALVAEQRKAHHTAGHHCSAFVLGPDQSLVRAQDDGEPSGSAGMPMLTVLTGVGLSDVAAVVTRYFGGTLLGAGGLSRAYGGAVSAALDGAVRVRRSRLALFRIVAAHGVAGHLESTLRGRGVVIRNVTYGAEVVLTVAVRPDRSEELSSVLASATGGESVLREAGSDWVDEAAE
jgi:uncharacterized YigZ family protein